MPTPPGGGRPWVCATCARAPAARSRIQPTDPHPPRPRHGWPPRGDTTASGPGRCEQRGSGCRRGRSPGPAERALPPRGRFSRVARERPLRARPGGADDDPSSGHIAHASEKLSADLEHLGAADRGALPWVAVLPSSSSVVLLSFFISHFATSTWMGFRGHRSVASLFRLLGPAAASCWSRAPVADGPTSHAPCACACIGLIDRPEQVGTGQTGVDTASLHSPT